MALIVDPIRFAWRVCNPGVPLPATLARTAGSSALAQSLSDARFRMTGEAPASRAAAQAALELFILSESPTHTSTGASQDPNDSPAAQVFIATSPR
jgi:hypothetical protein